MNETSQNQVLEVCKWVQDFRKQGRYEQAQAYISSADPKTKRIPVVAIEIASLYLVQGHYIRAWQSCELPEFDIFLNGEPSAPLTHRIYDVDCVALALIKAYIGILRFSRLFTALKIAERVHDVWLVENPQRSTNHLEGLLPSESMDRYFESVLTSWKALNEPVRRPTGELKSSSSQLERAVSPSRIILECYYHKIQVAAGDQGLLDKVQTKSSASKRMQLLTDWLLARNRLCEAVFATTCNLNPPSSLEDIETLKKVLTSLQGKNLVCEEAAIEYAIADCMINLSDGALNEEVLQHFELAGNLFKEYHEFGLLDVKCRQYALSTASRKPKEILSRNLELAENYLAKQCYQRAINCLLSWVPTPANMGEVREQFQSIMETARQEISRVGGEFLEQRLFLTIIYQGVMNAPQYGYVQQCIEDYVKRLPSEMSPIMEGSLYKYLSLVYHNLKNFGSARLWAEKAMDAFSKGKSYMNLSDAALLLASIKNAAGGPGADMPLLERWADFDRDARYHVGEVEKCVQLARSYGLNNQWALFHTFLERAEVCASRNNVAMQDVDDLLIARAADGLDEAVKLAYYTLGEIKCAENASKLSVGQEYMRTSRIIGMRYAHSKRKRGFQPGPDSMDAIDKDLLLASNYAFKAFECFKVSGGTEMIVSISNDLYDLLKDWPSSARTEMIEAWLEDIETAEQICDSMRRSLLPIERIESLLEKRRVVADNELQRLYSNAVEACLVQGKADQAWQWLQRGKARALSEILGIRAAIPERLLSQIKADYDARALYEQVLESNASIARAPPKDLYAARERANNIREQMSQHPLLAQLLDIREGMYNIAIGEEEMQTALDLSGRESGTVKYIDWVIPHEKAKDPRIVLLVRSSNGITDATTLAITAQIVDEWIEKVLTSPSDLEPPLATGER